MILPELLSRIYSVSFLSSVPIWLGQKWVLLHQKCAVKFPIRLSIAFMRPNPQHAHRCRVLAKTQNLEPNRKRRKLTDASKPGRKFEFKSLSGVDPLEQVLETALPQLGSPCVQLLPCSLQATWVNAATRSVLGPSFLHVPTLGPGLPRCSKSSVKLRNDRRGLGLPSTHSSSDKEGPQTILGGRVIARDSDWQPSFCKEEVKTCSSYMDNSGFSGSVRHEPILARG